jgi:hypothetical protein
MWLEDPILGGAGLVNVLSRSHALMCALSSFSSPGYSRGNFTFLRPTLEDPKEPHYGRSPMQQEIKIMKFPTKRQNKATFQGNPKLSSLRFSLPFY